MLVKFKVRSLFYCELAILGEAFLYGTCLHTPPARRYISLLKALIQFWFSKAAELSYEAAELSSEAAEFSSEAKELSYEAAELSSEATKFSSGRFA